MSRFVEFQIARGGPLSYPFVGDRILVNRGQVVAVNPVKIEGYADGSTQVLHLNNGCSVPVMGFLSEVLQKLEGTE